MTANAHQSGSLTVGKVDAEQTRHLTKRFAAAAGRYHLGNT